MQRQAESRPPWSPLSVTVISLILPTGGAILTVLNLQRLRQIDRRDARRMTIALVALFALALTSLILLAGFGSDGRPRIDPTAVEVLSLGVAFASYAVQRRPFRAWRLSNLRARTSPWLAALGVAAVYHLVTVAAWLPLFALIEGLLYLGRLVLHG